MALEVIEATDTLTHVALRGKLTMLGVERLTGSVQEKVAARGVNAIIDMAGVTFIASVGISMLLQCRKQLTAAGAKVVLLGPTPEVARTLHTARIDKLFPIVDSLEEAHRALADE